MQILRKRRILGRRPGYAVLLLLTAVWVFVAPAFIPAAAGADDRYDYGCDLSNKMRAFFKLRKQLELVVLGDSRAMQGVDSQFFYTQPDKGARPFYTNEDYPIAFNLAVQSCGLDFNLIMVQDYLPHMPKLKWVLYGISPRLFNRFWGSGIGGRLRSSPGYQYDISHGQRIWSAPAPRMVRVTDLRGITNKNISPWGFMPRRGEFRNTSDRNAQDRMRRAVAGGRFELSEGRVAEFEQIIRKLADQNVRILAFTPPMHYYLALADCADDDGTTNAGYWTLMARLRALEKKYPNYFFYDIHQNGKNEFRDEHFADFDHLNELGAEKLARTLDFFRSQREGMPGNQHATSATTRAAH